MKKSVMLRMVAFSSALLLLAGCSNPNINNTSSVSSSSSASAASSSTQSALNSSSQSASSQNSSSAAQQDSSQPSSSAQKLYSNILLAAPQGQIINCEFAIKKNIVDVQAKWGKADTSDYVTAAKGTYDTYTKQGVAFGYNKGAQIFEVRSFDKQLSQITMSLVKNSMGEPGYDYKSNDEEVIGYKISDQYKILFVFSLKSKDPQLNHYSVF